MHRLAAVALALTGAAASSRLFVALPTNNLRGPLATSGANTNAITARSAGRAQIGSDGIFSGPALLVAAATVAVATLQVSRRRGRSGRSGVVVRHAGEITYGTVDPVTGEKNYVNPWEQRVEDDLMIDKTAKPTPSGPKYLRYEGPVYKKVPVVEGLQFPLDPTLYQEPLQPPEPGVKWGDGRAPDGNWYMEVDGKQVQYWQGVGRRKTACAIVRIVKGNGQFIVNGREAIEYFQLYPIHWLKACEPMTALSVKNDFDCLCKTFGGGKSGQAGAIRLGLARAMQEFNFNWRPLLKKAKYLTRDWRTVESKKTGKPKARKSTPFHKR